MRKLKIILLLLICCISCTVVTLAEPQTTGTEINQTTGTKNRDIKDVNCTPYLAYLEQSGKTPVEYLLDKFKYHPIIIVGELHHIQQNLELLQELIPKLYKQAGVRFLGYEFFASSCQKDIDRLVNSKEYDSVLEKKIIRESAIRWGMMWPYQEYVNVFKIVWKLNQEIADQSERFRIVFMAPDNNWHDYYYGNGQQKRAIQMELMEGDKYYAEPIMREFDHTGHKGLIWCGSDHAVTRLIGNPQKGPELRCGGYLYKQYGEKVFQIMLHGFWYYRNRPTATDYAMDGLLEDVLNKYGKPIGFDIAESPFADIKLPKDYVWAIDNPGSTFAKYCDGYIWMVPLEKFKANQVMNIAEIVPNEEIFHKIIQNASSKSMQEMKSRQELLAVYKELENKFRHFQQTFMPFLSAQPNLNISDSYKLIEEQESPQGKQISSEAHMDNEKDERQSVKEIARKLFQACSDEDWGEFSKLWPNLLPNEMLTSILGGLEIISIGEPFKMDDPATWHVPYKIKLKVGEIKKRNLRVHYDKTVKKFVVCGGL